MSEIWLELTCKYGTGPAQQVKITKYTGPTQDKQNLINKCQVIYWHIARNAYTPLAKFWSKATLTIQILFQFSWFLGEKVNIIHDISYSTLI